MEDLREIEIQNIKEICTLLSSQYPQLLKLEEYDHPVKGTRNSLNIIPKDKSVDIELLKEIDVNFIDRTLTIKTQHRSFILDNIFKDVTVI